MCVQSLQDNLFARRNKTALKIEYVGYIFCLNRLKLVENIPQRLKKKIKIKFLWIRLWDPSELHMPLLGSPSPGPMYLLYPLPIIGPVCSLSLYIVIVN